MADPAPPLTEEDPLSEWIARMVFAFPSGDSRRDDIRVLAARALTLESELAQLRREKAERAALESELERERREISRLRDELVTAQHETDLASERACKLMLELERLRGELARP